MDDALIPPTAASSILNCYISNSWLEPRRGFKHLSSGGVPSGFSAAYGLTYMQGYNSSNALVEEYVTVQTRSGNTYPYALNVTTGAGTQIQGPGPTNIALNASKWRGFAFNGYGYLINGNDTYPICRYTIGLRNDLIQVKAPTAPTVAPTFTVTTPSGSGYSALAWTGVVVGSDIAYSGSSKSSGSSVDASGYLNIAHLAGGSGGSPGISGVKVNLLTHIGEQDWRYNDRFGITLAATPGSGIEVTIDWSGTTFTFYMDDGSAWSATILEQSVTGQVRTTGATVCYFALGFDGKISGGVSARSPWQNVKYVEIKWNLLTGFGSTVAPKIQISPITIGGVILGHRPTRAFGDGVDIAYSYYSSSTGLESGLSPTTRVYTGYTQGSFYSTLLTQLGALITVNGTASSDGTVDSYRFYLLESDYFKLGSNSTATASWNLTEPEVMIEANRYSPSNFIYTNIQGAIPFKGWVVWLSKVGYQNIMHSRVGAPLSIASARDQLNDDARGQTFSLSDNYADVPLCGCQADDTLLIGGNSGVYAQVATAAVVADSLGYRRVGITPSLMLPPKRVPSAKPVAGMDACARWHDQAGAPGMAYVDPDGEVWFVRVSSSFDGTVGYELMWLSEPIYSTPRSFLMTGQSLTDFSGVMVGVDEFSDALWIVLGARAMVLRKPDIAQQNRHWELYSFALGTGVTIEAISFTPNRRIRALHSNGKVCEYEYDSTSNNAPITGSLRDDGAAMPDGYWKSKRFRAKGMNQVVLAAVVERDSLSDTPTLTAYTTDKPSGQAVQVAANTTRIRFDTDTTGRYAQFLVNMKETYSPIRQIIVDLSPLGIRGLN